MPAIRSCLDHRHAYVRRNAVLAIYTIFKLVGAFSPDLNILLLITLIVFFVIVSETLTS